MFPVNKSQPTEKIWKGKEKLTLKRVKTNISKITQPVFYIKRHLRQKSVKLLKTLCQSFIVLVYAND